MLIQGKILTYGDDISEVVQIRREVFLNEYGVTEEEIDYIDNMAMHVIVYEEDNNWKENVSQYKKSVASGRIFFDGTQCIIDKVCVLKEFRNKKYGDFTVKMLLNKAFTSGIDKVELYSPDNVVGFFKTIGFQETNENFMKCEVKYVKMIISSKGVITYCAKKN